MNRELDWSALYLPALLMKRHELNKILAMLMPISRRSIKMTYYKYYSLKYNLLVYVIQ